MMTNHFHRETSCFVSGFIGKSNVDNVLPEKKDTLLMLDFHRRTFLSLQIDAFFYEVKCF